MRRLTGMPVCIGSWSRILYEHDILHHISPTVETAAGERIYPARITVSAIMRYTIPSIITAAVVCSISKIIIDVTQQVHAFSATPPPMMIQVNDKIPMVDLHYGFPPQYVNSAFYASNKNLLVLCLPGAYTPT